MGEIIKPFNNVCVRFSSAVNAKFSNLLRKQFPASELLPTLNYSIISIAPTHMHTQRGHLINFLIKTKYIYAMWKLILISAGLDHRSY